MCRLSSVDDDMEEGFWTSTFDETGHSGGFKNLEWNYLRTRRVWFDAPSVKLYWVPNKLYVNRVNPHIF